MPDLKENIINLTQREPTPAEVTAAPRLASRGSFALQMSYLDAVMLVAHVQAALRHPDNRGPAAQRMTRFAWAIRDHLVEVEPDIASMLDSGWNGVPVSRQNG